MAIQPPDPDYDDEDGPPNVPEPPIVDPVPRKTMARVQSRPPLPPRTPNYRPPEDPNEVKARYHISEIPGYNGLADENGEPIWEGNPGDGSYNPNRAPLSR